MAKRGPREYPWFRCYVEMTRDLKIRLEPVNTRYTWVAVLTLARRSPQPGRLLLSDGVPVTVAHVADEANVPIKAAAAALDTFRTQKMLAEDADGVLVVINWDKRQPESKAKQTGNSPEIDGEFQANSPETRRTNASTLLLDAEEEGEVEEDSSPPDHLLEKTESEQKQTPAPQAARPRSSGSVKVDYQAEFDGWWRVWPRKEDRKKALISYVRRRKAGRSAAALLKAAENFREYCRVAKPPPDKLPFPTTFLNADRDEEWEGGIPEARQVEMRRVNPRATPHDKTDRSWENFTWRDGDEPIQDAPLPEPPVVAEPRPYLPHPVPT